MKNSYFDSPPPQIFRLEPVEGGAQGGAQGGFGGSQSGFGGSHGGAS